MADVVMPRLSDSMEEGTILRWLKASGDEVAHGEDLVEIETDKANMVYESDQDGPLEIVAQEGDTLPIGALIARIGGGGGAQPVAVAAEAGAQAEGATATADAQATGTGGVAPPEPSAAPAAPPAPPAPPPTPAGDGNGRIKASPIARRMARERGLDLASLAGTGPGGRIVKADVEAAAASAIAPPAVAEPAAAPAPTRPAVAPAAGMGDPATAKGEVTVRELTKTQQVIARRMAEAKATVPEFTLTTEVEATPLVDLRTQLKALGGEEPTPSFNDMIVKASALALREHPLANAAYRDGRFELFSRVNVGVAVAAQDALVVPTVFDADRKSLGEIARETRALAQRVRDGQITPPELAGGTFTVSNLGMFGITEFTAVINPPQAAILSVGALREAPVARDGRIEPGHLMTLTLACDHRILYGAPAAEFLAAIRDKLGAPLALAL